ncbi:AEC family transporter [Eremococcus coleocola]|uniref:AEC family transporter n=1 Tax=Eremococcus coleocola TaxID=88132 RepID=UPI000415C917|nr:AEC family transporter [Eremococcus coleocola]
MFMLAGQQLIIMGLLMAIGFIAYKSHFIKPETQKDFSNILVYIAMPSVIINVFQRPFDNNTLRMIGWAALASASIYLLSILIAEICFRDSKVANPEHQVALKFGTIFTNASFMGIPLAQAVLGDDGVLFMVIHLIGYTLFQWTYGITLYRKNPEPWKAQLKKLSLNPNIIATVVGIGFWLVSFKLPTLIGQPVSYLASLNTPLSMLLIGSNIATAQIQSGFKRKHIWQGFALSNLIIPLISIFVLQLFPLSPVAFQSLVLGVSCPVAGMVVIFAVLHDHHNQFPVQLMCISTTLSVVTIPVILSVLEWMH